MNPLRRYQTFIFFLSVDRGRFVLFLFLLLLGAVSESVQPIFYKFFVDSVSSGVLSAVMTVLWGYIGIRIFSMAVDNLHWLIADSLVIRAAKDARIAAMKKIQDLDLAYHQSKSTGGLISCIRRGDGAFFSLFDSSVQLVRIAINFIVVLAFFSAFNWQIAFLMFGSFVFNALIARFVILNNINKRRDFNKSEDEVSGLIVDNLLN